MRSIKNEENYKDLKSQCADRWSKRIKDGGYSISVEAAQKKLQSRGEKEPKTLKFWLERERRAFRWKNLDLDGKLGLIDKKEMKAIISKSPDFMETWIEREIFELVQTYTIHNERRLLYW